MGDQDDGAFVVGEGADEGLAGVDVEVVGGLVEDEELRGVAGGQGQEYAGFLAAADVAAGGFGAVGVEAETSELGAQ